MNFIPDFLRREQPQIINGDLQQFHELEPELVEPVELIAPTGKLIAHCGTTLITRAELAEIEAPQGTRTHQPIRHIDVVSAVIEDPWIQAHQRHT